VREARLGRAEGKRSMMTLKLLVVVIICLIPVLSLDDRHQSNDRR